MKKQINPTTKAHLLRSAFILLPLFAVCVIPFALAQRGIGKRSLVPTGTYPTPWQLVASMPVDLYGASTATDGTFMFSAGGYSFSAGGTQTVLNRYDPITDTWTPWHPYLLGNPWALPFTIRPLTRFTCSAARRLTAGRFTI